MDLTSYDKLVNPETELLFLPDGRVLAHNLTPAMARLLGDLAPADSLMRQRAAIAGIVQPEGHSPQAQTTDIPSNRMSQ